MGAAAAFRQPRGLTLDGPREALYVADTGNHLIRRVSLAEADYGNVTTLAGTGIEAQPGDPEDASAALATFSSPLSVHVNDSWVYVADSGAHRVRRVPADGGNVTELAGGINLAPGHLDGLGAGALFNGPAGLASSGRRLYVSDRNSHVVRQLEVEDPVELVLSVKAAETVDYAAMKERCFFRKGSLPCETDACFPKDYDEFRCSNTIQEYCTGIAAGAEFDPQCKMYGHDQFGSLEVSPMRSSQDSALSLTRHHHQELLNIGQYSVDGGPDNTTSHISDHLTYAGETHELNFCSYPSALYTFHFRGQVNASVSEAASASGSGSVLMAYRGLHTHSERQSVWQLAGPGCRDPLAANYNPFATVDDGSCVSPYTVEYAVRALGQFGYYSVEGPGIFVDDKLLPLPEGAEADEEHSIQLPLLPGAEYHFIASGHLNATLTGLQEGNRVFSYQAENTSSVFHTSFIPPAPGCTNSSFINYNPYATSDDGTCIMGHEVRVEVHAAELSAANAAQNNTFFQHGSYVIESPAQGGYTWISPPHMFRAAGEWHNQTLFLPPGEHDVHFYGNVSVGVRLPQADGAALLEVNATEESILFCDDFGYALAAPLYNFRTRPGRATFVVPLGGSEIVSLGVHGGQTGRPDPTTGEGALDVPEGAIGAGTIYVQVRRVDDAHFLGLPRQMSQIFSYTPHRLKFLKPVTVMLPYFAHGVPSHSSEGSGQLMFMRATDARGLDWRAQGGAVFQDGVGYLQTEALGLFGIFAGPEVTAVGPAEASSRGGDILEVRGTEVAHCFASTGSLCQLGTAPLQYAVAQVVDRGEEPGRVLCQLPALRPGFVSLELLNPERFIVSESGVQFLSREPAVSLHAFPDHASVHVPSLAFVRGRHFHSVAGLQRCHFQSASSSRPAGSRPAAASPSSTTSTSSIASPHCVSSAICVCETPVGPDFVSTILSDSRKTSSFSLGAGEPSGKPLRFGLLDVPPVVAAGGRGMEYSGGDVRVRFSGRQALPGIADGMFECRIGTTGSAARKVGFPFGELACFAPLMPPGDRAVSVSLYHAVLQAAAGVYTSAPALPSFGRAPESLLEPPVAGGIELFAEPHPLGAFVAQLSPAQLLCSLGAADTLATPLKEVPSRERLWWCDLPRASPGFHALILSELSASGPPLRRAALSLAVRVRPELERIEPRVAYEGDVRRLCGKSLAAGSAAFRISDLHTEWFEDLPGHWVSSALAYVFVFAPPGTFAGPAASRSVRGDVSPGGGDAAEAVTVTSIAPGLACDEEPEALGAGGSRYGDDFHSTLGGSVVVADVAHEEMDARCSLGSTSHLAVQLLSPDRVQCVLPAHAPGRVAFSVHSRQGSRRFSPGRGGGGLVLREPNLSLDAVAPGSRGAGGAQELTVHVDVIGEGHRQAPEETLHLLRDGLQCSVEGRLGRQEAPLRGGVNFPPGPTSSIPWPGEGSFSGACFFPRLQTLRFETLHLTFQGSGAPASPSSVEFLVRAEPMVVRVSPDLLSQAGSLVTLTGRRFDPTDPQTCRYTEVLLPPGGLKEGAPPPGAAAQIRAVSSSQAVCEYPGASATTSGERNVHLHVSAAHSAGAGPSVPVVLRAAALPELVKLRPSEGSHEGGTVVRLYGRSLQGSQRTCFFGAVAVTAQAINSTAAECVAPSHGPGAVMFSLSDGGNTPGACGSDFRFNFV